VYKIAKRFKFDAAHRLEGLPEGHKCGNLHGHTYTVEVVLAARDLDPKYQWVEDYGDLKPFKTFIDNNLDHKFLNNVPMLGQSTAENLAKYLFDIAEQMFRNRTASVWAVRVSETESTWAEYSR